MVIHLNNFSKYYANESSTFKSVNEELFKWSMRATTQRKMYGLWAEDTLAFYNLTYV